MQRLVIRKLIDGADPYVLERRSFFRTREIGNLSGFEFEGTLLIQYFSRVATALKRGAKLRKVRQRFRHRNPASETDDPSRPLEFGKEADILKICCPF